LARNWTTLEELRAIRLIVSRRRFEAKKLVIDGVDVAKKLTELSSKAESQQKQIEELSKQLREMKK